MRMIPVRSRLTGNGKVVQKRLVRDDRTLIDESRAVHFGRPGLEESVPMLIMYLANDGVARCR